MRISDWSSDVCSSDLGLMAFEGVGGQDSPMINVFWLALAFIIMGVGFLKANISAIVGQLYGQGDPRRDPAFTIFYMGITVGAATGAIIAGYTGQTYSSEESLVGQECVRSCRHQWSESH